ncbi:uncharacterized protein PV09_03072 [Verruconis gallopava]|uniref:Uncharacterized protein n=1 Tax=Verruconis gallopava TaxID=253628 RepID=A0A0D1YYV2_9PEZI|nr:uncharacterized protein PV09_03072 [Verruconis gallopava]KIW05872.1 hypothetical protein PV09_03072 [Verruconis gallopava]
MRFLCLFSVPLFAGFAIADVKFTSPAAGSSHAGGGSLQVTWEDSGTAPALSDLTTYQLFLCAGGNDASSIVQLASLVADGTFAVTGNSAEAFVDASIGASTPENAYFLKMISVAATGGTVINYSSRFSLTGMTGSFPASVITAMSTVSGTNGPDTENNVGQAATTAATGAQGSFAIPFAEQTGPFRYASMQQVPPTKITKQTKTPINPTSPYTLATTFLPPQTSIQSTVTESVTWSFSQMENTVAAASGPSGDMQKFLNRWKD